MTLSERKKLKELCEKAEQGPKGTSELMYAATSEAIKSLLLQVEELESELNYFIENHDPFNPKSDYVNALRCARQALSRAKELEGSGK